MEASDRQWEVEEQALLDAIDQVVDVMEREGVPYLFMGGIASSVHGRPRWTHDVDVFVRPQHARGVLRALEQSGFRTEESDPFWLFKAWYEDVLVDVIFRSHGDIYLDDEMLSRAAKADFMGRQLRVVPPEDLLVIKALVHAEHSPRHWHDGLALIANCDLDWDYLLMRANHGPRRVLSMLFYAQSNDLPVPDSSIERLLEVIEGREEDGS
jgi:predicted nucleotidyltransferase